MDNEKPFESGIETSSACKSPDQTGTATSSPRHTVENDQISFPSLPLFDSFLQRFYGS
jgi:hypothetical protein